ncbi:MAG TPA: ankyrin repeat domain-containing protein, partial [Candidatus Babeliales bacterium]|nr:ankyrin repeat domain-containing protein [Candidatus Babeliales bacterium]
AAVTGGRLAEVKALLNNPEISPVRRTRALVAACSLIVPDEPIVQALLANGADANQALRVVAYSSWQNSSWQNTRTIARLLEIPGINVNATNEYGDTALILAISKGHLEIVNLLLAVPGINVNGADQIGFTALILAVCTGHLEIVNSLLAAPGIDVNATNASGINALLCATDKGHLKIVNLLLAVPGIDVNHRSNNSTTALALACRSTISEITELLLSAGATVPPGLVNNIWLRGIQATLAARTTRFIAAAKAGDITAMKQALARGFPERMALLQRTLTEINKQATPNFAAVLHVLLVAGVNIDEQVLLPAGTRIVPKETATAGIVVDEDHPADLGPEPFSALDFAILANQPEQVKTLLERGARTDQLNPRTQQYLGAREAYPDRPITAMSEMIADATQGQTAIGQAMVADDQTVAA